MRFILLLLFGLLFVGCMRVPEGLTIVETKDPASLCVFHVNCYRPDLRMIVLVPGQTSKTVFHEACHAHQHQTIMDERGDDAQVTIDLREWLTTDEASSYARVVKRAGPAPWSATLPGLIQDFAESCGRYLAQDADFPNEPNRNAWFEERNF